MSTQAENKKHSEDILAEVLKVIDSGNGMVETVEMIEGVKVSISLANVFATLATIPDGPSLNKHGSAA